MTQGSELRDGFGAKDMVRQALPPLRAEGETGGTGRQVSLGLWAGPVLTAGLSDELSGRACPGIDIFWGLGSSLIFPLQLCLRHQVSS